MSSLNFALIGRGRFGKNHERAIRSAAGVNLREIATKTKGNVRKVLADPKIDAVVIATPPKTHAALALYAIKHKKHVLLEKPMTTSLRDAARLRLALKKSPVTFMVGYQYLYNDYVRHIKREIEFGKLGKIKQILLEHFQSPERQDADAFWDAAPHPLSIVYFLFGAQKIRSAKGQKNKKSAVAEVKFGGGLKVNLMIFREWPEKIRRLTIFGARATAVLDETQKSQKLKIISKNGAYFPKIKAREPLRNQLEHFIYSTRNKKTPLTNIDMGIRTTSWLEKIFKKLMTLRY